MLSLVNTQSKDINQDQLHFFSDNYNLWYHLPNDPDWSMNSYKLIDTIESIEKYLEINDMLNEEVIKYCMLFLMKSEISPRWEDKFNKDGGCFSYKVTNKHVKETWRDLSFLFQGKMISENKDFVNDINGISISPKKNFCIIKLWLKSCNFINPKIVSSELIHLNPIGCLFKKHSNN
jgi:translation initiation factor 4E